MTLQEILRVKGHMVLTIQPDSSLEDVIQKLVKHNCGSLVVCAEENPRGVLGIITERDILRACADRSASLGQITVREVMTVDLATGSPGDSVEQVMGLMTNRRIRHLPVLENDELRGMISIGDIVKAQHDALSMENHYLKTYIHGDVETAVAQAVSIRPR